MSEWDYIEHHLDIASAAMHAEADCLPVTSPPTWCCSTFPTDRNSAVQQPLTHNDTAIRRQGITNLTCRDSSQ